jgi:hypothetical protein
MGLAGLFVVSSVLAASPDPGRAPSSPQADRIAQITDQIANRQAAAPIWLVVLTGLFALLITGSFVMARWLVVASHAGGHAMAASTFGELTSLSMQRSPNAVAALKYKHQGDALSGFLTTFIGCFGPSVFGLLGAFMLSRDHIVAVLWTAILLLVLLFWVNSGLFGAFMLLMLGGGILAVAWVNASALHTVVAYLLVWSLLWGGVQDLLVVMGPAGRAAEAAAAKSKKGPVTCQGELRKHTYVPRGVWGFLQLIPCALAFCYGARLLLFEV